MKAIMLDLETLALDSEALVLSIGAVEFDPIIGLGKEFYVSVKQDKQSSKWGRSVDPRTVKWWEEQSPEARAVLTDPQAVYLDTALGKFANYLGGRDIDIWGNGANFDNVILANAYKGTGVPAPWSFRKDRCFRTLKALGISLVNPDDRPRESFGPHHNALADAKYQAWWAIQYLREIK